MNDKDKRFPLPLSSVIDRNTGRGQSSGLRGARFEPTVTTVSNGANKSVNGAANMNGAASKGESRGASYRAPTTPVAGVNQRLAVTSMPAAPLRQSALVSDGVRAAMVARLARQGVRDAKVLAAMEAVPRHLFVEPALASQAYVDASLPIGHHQTISQPYIVARMLEVLKANANGVLDRVLEIGTGCGYQAAVLSRIAAEVYSIERIKPLHELAKANLRPLRIANIRLHYGDGMLGLPQAAPFDGIILAAAGLEVPHALLEQMKIGGRLVAPVGAERQVLLLIERLGRADWRSTTLEDCHFVPLRPGVI